MKTKFSISAILFLALVLGLAIPLQAALAASVDWSDNFDSGAQQAWTVVDGGDSSTTVFGNHRYELHTESDDGSAKSLVSYVDVSATDYIIQAKLQRMEAGNNFLAYLLARATPASGNGYVMGVDSAGNHLWFGKLTAGAYSDMTPSHIEAVTFDPASTQVKFAVSGSNLFGKVWSTGSTEPDHWQIIASDSSYTSGVGGVMLATYPTLSWNNVQVAFDDVSLTTPATVWVDDDWSTANAGDIVGGHTFGYDAFATIQGGVGGVAAGGTVNVAAGTYNEAITLNKPLYMIGAGEDVTFIDGTGLTSSTLFSATGLTSGILDISGFTFTDDPTPTATMTYLVSFSGCLTPATINFTDNTVVGAGDEITDWGLLAQNNTCSIVINDNTFDNIAGNSIMLERSTGSVEIGTNIFLVPDDGGPAIWSMSYGTAGDPRTVDGLQWYHDNQISAKNVSIYSGITIAPAWGTGWNVRQYGSYTNVLIEDNIIEDFQSVGVQVEVDGTNSTFNGEIKNNTLTAYPSIAASKGIRLLGPVTNTKLTGNIITQGYRGIYLSGTWGQPIYPSGITVEKNQLAANVIGFEEADTITDQDASPNWWGSIGGPAAGYIVNNAMYIPWCTNIECTTFGYPPVHNITRGTYFATIQAAINDAATVNGDVIEAAAGTYLEDVTINKGVTLRGAGIDLSTIKGLKTGANTATVRVATSAGVVIEGFTITRDGNNPTDWGTNVKLTGVAIQAAAGNAEVRNNKFTGNRTAIDLNNTSGNLIHNNVIDFNRTGIVLRNRCPNNSIYENDVTDNWTIGILWLAAATTDDAPGTTFFNNKIEGNWYTQIENRSLTGGVKNFSGNWLGSTALTTAATDGSEEAYATQIPTEYGGTDTPPGGAVSVRGAGIGDMDYTPWLGSATDTNVNNGTGTTGFQGDFSSLYVTAAHGQTGTTGRIQEGINLVSGSTVNVVAGTYTDPILVNKAVTLLGPNSAINPNTGVRVSEAVLQGTTPSGLSNFLELDAENVAIKGFTFDNLRIDNYYNTTGTNTNLIGGVAIENNIFSNVLGTAIYLRDGRDAPGLYSTGVSILNNKIVSPGSGGSLDYQAGSGMVILGAEASTISGNVAISAAYNGIQLARCNGMTLTGNIATGAVQPALQIAQWNDGIFTISGNTFSTTSIVKAAVRLYGFTNNYYPVFNFTGNTIKDSKYGAQIGREDTGLYDIRDADYSFSGNTFTNIGTYRLVVYLSATATPSEKTEMDVLFAQAYAPGSTAKLITSAVPFTYIGMPAVVWVDDDYTSGSSGGHIWGYDAFATVQGGIGGVAPSGTVNVAAGTYTETGQIVISKNITLVGENKTTTIIKPAQDTSGSGDAGSWILVDNDITFNISKVTLDGVGRSIRQGVRYNGSGVVDDVIIRNMVQAGYMGFGIVQGYTNTSPRTLTVTNSTFTNFGRVGIQADDGGGGSTVTISNNVITCLGSGDNVNYGITVEGGAVATITGNNISNCYGVASTDGSESAAIEASTYFALGTTATITGNTIHDNLNGILIGYDGTDSSSITASGNTFTNNTATSIFATNGTVIDIAAALAGNTFDKKVTVTHSGSLLPVIWSKIQLVIDAAVAGDTVNVPAGTYNETLNIESRSDLSIVGEDKATTIIRAAAGQNWNACGLTNERKTVIRIVNSTGINLSGLTLDMALAKGNNVFAALYCDSTGSFNDNILKNNQLPDAGGGYYELGLGIRTSATTTYTDAARAAVTVDGNTFENAGRVAINIHGFTDVTITDNLFYKDENDFGYGIELGSQSIGTISGNEFYGFDTEALSDGSDSAGIYIENAFTGSIVTPIAKNVTIDNNHIHHNQCAVWIGNEYDGYAGNVDISVDLTDNNIHDNSLCGVYITDEDKSAGSSVTVTGGGNTITDNGLYGYLIHTAGDGAIVVDLSGDTITNSGTGVLVEDTGTSSTSTYSVAVNSSTISGNLTSGINNTVPGLMVDATYNWWGAADGPSGAYIGSGDAVSINVDIFPYYIDSGLTQFTHFVHNITRDTYYGYIQAAIDDSVTQNGDVIAVSSGIFVENVVVSKTLTIGGAGASTIVMPAVSNPNPCTGSSLCGGAASNVFLIQANNVIIHDLTVDGDNPDLTSGIVRGGADLDARNGIIVNNAAVYTGVGIHHVTVQNIYLRGIQQSSGGTFDIHHNTVTNVQGDYYSIALFAWYGPGIFANNTVSYANDGISANHSKGIQFTNNTVSYSGSGIHTDNSGDTVGSVSDVISGNTVSNCLGNDYGIWTFVNYLPIAVENNSVSGCALPYSAWGSANTTIATFTNNTATAPSPNTGSVGIYVTTSEAGWGYADVYANFTGNALSGFETGIALSADETTWDPDPYVAKTIHSTIYRNNITGSTEMAVFQGTSGAYDIHLEENWWGSFMGPQRPISSNVDVIQWCGTANPTCLPLLPVDGTITLSGTIDEPGGLNVYVPGLTILLADGTVVQNTGAGCFSVYASQTTIQAASKLGAQCIPGTGYNGVDVAAGLQNVNVGNIEFLGPGMDGVHFAGVTDYLWVWDNWFHTLSGDALEFVSQPTGTISIQGNLFQENDGLGISTGAFVVPAEFNSWGHIGGASLGDGASPTVDADPWTHVDMYLTSSDPVSIGGNVTYTVYGNYENVMGAAFTLAYPTDKLQLVGTPTNLSGFVAAGPTLFDTTTLGAVKFNGIVPGSTPITGANLPIYRATFKVLADGALLDLLDTDDLFSMAPNDAGPSTNIYALKLVDAWVTIHHYTVTGTVYMQGRSVRSGVPATLNDLVYYGLYNAVSTQTPIPGNLVFSNVAAGTYLFTTNQARYLNIPDSMAKTFVLSANRTLPNLTLKGGNAIWTDNIIDVNDAAKVGTDYGIGDITDDSDVNFSGAVDIFDLTMVGLNFDLTSETAYGTWVP